MKRSIRSVVIGSVVLSAMILIALPVPEAQAAIAFDKSSLQAETSSFPTSLQFGPDGRLYVAQFNGLIKVYDIVREGPNDYTVVATQTITSVQAIPNRNDNGTLNSSVSNRLVTGLVVGGTAANPVIYVTSSDPRIGGGDGGQDLNLDTNSGIISRLTWNGTSWVKLDIVRGLPRSEENHTANGMALSGNTLYVAQGGNTNQGAPSNNFALLPEFALSAGILSVDLAAIGNSTYDLPTLDDEDRSGNPDANDPFGGNDGKNQAKLVPGGPVQVYSPGYRNPYDVLITQSGKMYTIDNGANPGWGGIPASEGSGGNCTNAVSEPGDKDMDHLHLITGPGYYGGHPNPARGNISNTFNGTNPQSPVSSENAVECDYRDPATAADGNLATFAGSTNGIAEYTASNFDGEMTGDLITAAYSTNAVYRVKLNSSGTGVVLNQTLFSTVGGNPLDVTIPGPGAPFAGTIWVADTNGAIWIFEPNDFECSGADSTSLDEDGDGYSNADEIDNGTNPCSSADLPPDWDNDDVSNLNDPDDDNDSQSDTTDPFAIDPDNGMATTLPATYAWENDDPDPGGLVGLGFTGLMTNGSVNYASLFDPNNMTAGGAAGVTTVGAVPAGDAYATGNSQQYGFQFGVDAPTTGSFTAHSRILGPFAGISPQNSQSMGLFIGNGGQDDYVKITTAAANGTGIQFLKEVGGSVSNIRKNAVTLPGPDAVDLFLTVDTTTSKVQPSYVLTTGGVQGPRVNVGGPLEIPPGWFTSLTSGLAVGIISTSRGPGAPFPATWDLLEIVPGGGTTPPTPEQGIWQTRASSAVVRQEVSYVNANNRLYLTGSLKPGGQTHEVYDASTNTWSTVAQLPAKLDHIQGVELGGKIYYIGGLSKWPSPHASSVYIYDPATNTFTQGAPMPRGRGAGGVATFGGKIYYAGGLHNGVAVPWFDVYDPVADTWSTLPDMPRPKDHFHAVVANGRFWAIGGRNTSINATYNNNDSFSFAAGTWSASNAPLPTKRGGFAAAVLGDEILIIGGEGGAKTYNDVEAYNTLTDSWRALAPMPTARHGIQAAVCNGGVYIASGGETQGGQTPSNVHEVFFLNGPTSCTPGPTTPPPSGPIAEDAFGRTVSGGWGSADVGGSWSLFSGAASNFSVDGSAGKVATAEAEHQMALLNAITETDVSVTAKITFGSAVTTAGKLHGDLVLRRQGGSNYRIGIYLSSTGKISVRGQNSSGVLVMPAQDTGLTFAPGTSFMITAQAEGTNPTTLRAKVWAAGTTEPTAWTATATDSTQGLQSPGSIGLRMLNSTGVIEEVRFDDLLATKLP